MWNMNEFSPVRIGFVFNKKITELFALCAEKIFYSLSIYFKFVLVIPTIPVKPIIYLPYGVKKSCVMRIPVFKRTF